MGKTTAPADSVTLLQAIQKSGLLDAEIVAQVEQSLGQGGDATAVAKQLISDDHLTPWQARQLLRGFHALKLGNYKLRELVHKTECGRSFLAEHGKLGRQVSLTMLSPQGIERPRLVSDFLQDARSAASLDHRNLAHVYDVDQDGDRLFVVTEQIEGHSLQDLVSNGNSLTPLESAGIIRQAAAGLEHAHQAGVIHANLTPSNLIVDSDGVLKIINLGFRSLALEDEEGEGFCEEGEARDSSAGDMYSLGCLLHFALTGGPPVDGISPSITGELAKVCKVLLQTKGRPDAGRLATHLGKWLEKQVSEGMSTPPASVPTIQTANGSPVKAASDGDAIRIAVTTPGNVPTPVRAGNEAPAPGVNGARIQVGPGNGSRAGNGVSDDTTPRVGPEDSGTGGIQVEIRSSQETQVVSDTAAVQINPITSKSAPVDAVDEGSGGININLGGSGPQVTPAAPRSSRSPSAVENATDGASGINKWWLIGGGVALVVIVGAIVGFMMMGDKDKDSEVASAEDTKPAEVATSPEDDSKKDLESNPDLESDPSIPIVPSAPAPADSNPNPVAPQTPDAGPGASEPKGNPSTPAPAPDSDPSPSPKVEPKVEPKAEPKVEPKVEPKAEPKSKSDPKSPKNPTPPPKKPENPFVDFVSSTSLPPIGESKSLGKVYLDEKQLCFVKLRGGEDTIPKTKAVFKIKSGTELRDWSVIIEAPDSGSRVIAKLSHQDDQLHFQWSDVATAEPELANGLRNCVMALSVAGAESHICALREPTKMEPFVLKLDSASSQRWSLDGLPSYDRVHLEIEGIDGMDKFVLDPSGDMVIDRGTATIKVGETDEDQILYINLNTIVRGNSLELKATPLLNIKQVANKRVTGKTFPNLIKQVEIGGQQMEFKLNQMIEFRKKNGGKKDAGLEQAISLGQQDVEKLKKALARLKEMDQLVSGAEDGLVMHLRLFISAGNSEIEVMNTRGTPASATPQKANANAKNTPANGKNAKGKKAKAKQ